MISLATIVSSIIPQIPKESILELNNYMDWELHIKTLLQYHCLWSVVNGSVKKAHVPPSSSAKSIVSSSIFEIETRLGKDAHAHAHAMGSGKRSRWQAEWQYNR